MSQTSQQHPNAKSREWAIQFMYQCEIEKLYFFSDVHFDRFVKNFDVETARIPYMKRLVTGVFDRLGDLNDHIDGLSENWNLSRMPVIDRCILRMAALELIWRETPHRIIINEAIELAKKYSTEHSGSFVNGILDKLDKSITDKA